MHIHEVVSCFGLPQQLVASFLSWIERKLNNRATVMSKFHGARSKVRASRKEAMADSKAR